MNPYRQSLVVKLDERSVWQRIVIWFKRFREEKTSKANICSLCNTRIYPVPSCNNYFPCECVPYFLPKDHFYSKEYLGVLPISVSRGLPLATEEMEEGKISFLCTSCNKISHTTVSDFSPENLRLSCCGQGLLLGFVDSDM